jgi:hypothetical protein
MVLDLDIDEFPIDTLGSKLVHGKKEVDIPTQSYDEFIKLLEEAKVLNQTTIEWEIRGDKLITKAKFEIINLKKLKDVAAYIEGLLRDEPFGFKKHFDLFENHLKTTFGFLENERLQIKTMDIAYVEHFNFLNTLFYFETEDYIKLEKLSIYVDYSKPGSTFFSTYATVSLTNKLLTKWASLQLNLSHFVKFNKNTGILHIENKSIKFCEPDNTESNLMDLLVSKINERVQHEDLAMITWGHSTKEMMEKEYKKRKKTEVNQRNKTRINDLKKKLVKNHLEEKLKIVPCNGYMLKYDPPTVIDDDIKTILARAIDKQSVSF